MDIALPTYGPLVQCQALEDQVQRLTREAAARHVDDADVAAVVHINGLRRAATEQCIQEMQLAVVHERERGKELERALEALRGELADVQQQLCESRAAHAAVEAAMQSRVEAVLAAHTAERHGLQQWAGALGLRVPAFGDRVRAAAVGRDIAALPTAGAGPQGEQAGGEAGTVQSTSGSALQPLSPAEAIVCALAHDLSALPPAQLHTWPLVGPDLVRYLCFVLHSTPPLPLARPLCRTVLHYASSAASVSWVATRECLGALAALVPRWPLGSDGSDSVMCCAAATAANVLSITPRDRETVIASGLAQAMVAAMPHSVEAASGWFRPWAWLALGALENFVAASDRGKRMVVAEQGLPELLVRLIRHVSDLLPRIRALPHAPSGERTAGTGLSERDGTPAQRCCGLQLRAVFALLRMLASLAAARHSATALLQQGAIPALVHLVDRTCGELEPLAAAAQAAPASACGDTGGSEPPPPAVVRCAHLALPAAVAADSISTAGLALRVVANLCAWGREPQAMLLDVPGGSDLLLRILRHACPAQPGTPLATAAATGTGACASLLCVQELAAGAASCLANLAHNNLIAVARLARGVATTSLFLHAVRCSADWPPPAGPQARALLCRVLASVLWQGHDAVRQLLASDGVRALCDACKGAGAQQAEARGVRAPVEGARALAALAVQSAAKGGLAVGLRDDMAEALDWVVGDVFVRDGQRVPEWLRAATDMLGEGAAELRAAGAGMHQGLLSGPAYQWADASCSIDPTWVEE